MYGEGISKEGSILDVAANADIIKKSGSWYSYEGNKIGQGRENAKEYLVANPDKCQEIENSVRTFYNLSIDENDMRAISKAKAYSTEKKVETVTTE